MGVRLPVEYQEVEYIESSGTQYIVVNSVVLNAGLSAELDYMFTATQSGDQYLFQGTGSGGILSAECYSGSRWYVYCGLTVFSNVLSFVGNTLNEKHNLVMDSVSGTINIDGTVANKTGTRTGSDVQSFALFGKPDGSYLNTGLRIYNFILKNDGAESFNFVPCYRKSDHEPGVYDLVTRTFHDNDGTGEFLVGPDVKYGLPAEYQEVEYLESSGTQYINLGLNKSMVNGCFSIKAMIASSSPGNTQFVGCNIDQNNKLPKISIERNMFNLRQSRNAGFGSCQCNSVFIIRSDSNGDIYVNYEKRGTINVISTTGNEINLFNAIPESTQYAAKGRIYSFSLWDDNEWFIDLIPCYRRSDNKPGMYDLVSGTFFTNAGTGEFVVGPDIHRTISSRLMDRRRVLIAKLTSLFKRVITSQTGLASFDTNVVKPMKVTCEFNPKQDLHGYDNPWPAGGSANVWDEEWENGVIDTRTGEKTDNANQIRTKNYIPVTGGQEYYIKNSAGLWVFFYDSNKNLITEGLPDGESQSYYGRFFRNATCLIPNDCAYIMFYFIGSYGTAYNNDTAINYPSSVTTYSPYENICPIEGWTGANIYSGQNLIDFLSYFVGKSGITIDGDNTNGYTLTGLVSNLRAVEIPIPDTLVGKTIQITATMSPKTNGGIKWTVIGFGSTISLNSTYVSSGNVKRVSGTVTVTQSGGKFKLDYSAGDKEASVSDIMISGVGTGEYMPYKTIATLPITFNNPGTYDFLPIQVGTGDPSPENVRPITPGLTFTRDDSTTLEVYGGSLTVNADGTGTVTSKYYQCVYDGINKKVNNSYLNDTFIRGGDVYCNPNGQIYARENLFSDKLRASSPYDTPILYQVTSPAAGNLYLVFIVGLTEGSGVTNAAECVAYVNNWFQNNPTSVVYKLREDDYQTYTLSVAETSRAFEALGLGKNLGPLYGGTVTINEDGSCDVVADARGSAIRDHDWYYDAQYSRFATSSLVSIIKKPASNAVILAGLMCSAYKPDNAQHTGSNPINNTVGVPTSGMFYIRDESYTDVNTWIAAHGDETIVYPLATPQIYHFSSISELQSFLGTNNVWSDLNGAIAVEYYKKQQ